MKPASEQFMKELLELCQKHKLALVPTYEGQISFHDSMRIVELNQDTVEFLEQSYDE